MEPTKIIIENWPIDPWWKNWLPTIISILIAGAAVWISIKSLEYTKKEFIRNSRPYVYGINYSYKDKSGELHPAPWAVIFRTINAPSKILIQEVVFKFKDKIVSPVHRDSNFLRYPTQQDEWVFTMDSISWEKLIEKIPKAESIFFERHLSIDYQSIDGGRVYKYCMIQYFNFENYQWKEKNIDAN